MTISPALTSDSVSKFVAPSRKGASLLNVTLLAALVLPGCGKKPALGSGNFLGTNGDVVRMQERVFSWGHSFTLSMHDRTIATVEEKKFKLDQATTFTLKTPKGETLATARKKIFTYGTGTAIEVTDATGQTIGSIEKEVVKTFFSLGTVYVVKDQNGIVQAKSDQGIALSSTFNLTTASGAPVIGIKQDFINIFRTGWTMNISSNNIDSRIIAFIPAFKTYADGQK